MGINHDLHVDLLKHVPFVLTLVKLFSPLTEFECKVSSESHQFALNLMFSFSVSFCEFTLSQFKPFLFL